MLKITTFKVPTTNSQESQKAQELLLKLDCRWPLGGSEFNNNAVENPCVGYFVRNGYLGWTSDAFSFNTENVPEKSLNELEAICSEINPT